MTSPYSWTGLNTMRDSMIGQQNRAHNILLQYNDYVKRNRTNSSAVALSLLKQRNAALAQMKGTQRNYATYGNKWIAAGRPGAAAALEAKFKTPQEVVSKLTPYDPQGGVDALNAKRTLDQNLINLTGQENTLNQQYGTSRRDYEQKIPELARQLLSGYASRGMAFSSGYGSAVGEQQADIARGLSGLDQQKQQALADITSNRGLANTGYQNDLASSLVNTINRLSARAGTLGYGAKGKDIFNDPTLLVALAKKLLTQTSSPTMGTAVPGRIGG